MREEKLRSIRFLTRTALVLGCLFAAALGMGCSFDPLKYMSRNACEVFNCDELFFIEEMLPLSARPAGEAASGGGMDMDMDMDEAEDDAGGHGH